MDFKAIIGAVAPTIASFVGGPLAGGAVRQGLKAFGITGDAVPADTNDATALLADRVQNATPADLLALKKEDNAFAVEMRKLDLRESEAYMGDTQHARSVHADNRNVFFLGVVILLTFAVAMGMAMYGAYQIIAGGMGTDIDAGIIAAVFGFLGTAMGYVAANAQQVIAFFYGSSKGSKEKTDAMATAFRGLGK